jgi:tetratricopeptide (TPR) repeat protein
MDERLRQLMAQGKEHYDKREFDKAEPYLTQAVLASPSFADLHNMLGVIYHGQGRFSQAQESFEQALKINPAYTEAALNLAVTYNDLGKYREAKEVYGRAMAASRGQPRQLDPFARGKLANMHADVGDAYFGLGLNDEAAIEYRKALDLCPQFADLRTKLAQTMRDSGKLEDAVRELQLAKKDNPRYLPARINLGMTLFTLGRRDEAAREWEAVLTDDPDNKSCKMYLQMIRE